MTRRFPCPLLVACALGACEPDTPPVDDPPPPAEPTPCAVGDDAATEPLFAPDDEGCAGVAGFASADELASTPRDDAALEWVAARASERAIAPQSLYDRVVCEVDRVRAAFPSTRFEPYEWHAGGRGLNVVFATSSNDLAPADATTMSCLARALDGVVEDFGSTWTVSFPGMVNTPLVATRFAAIAGVAQAGPALIAGDGHEVRLETRDDVHRYAFVRRGGDCPSGCTTFDATLVEARPDGSIVIVARATTGSDDAWVEGPLFDE